MLKKTLILCLALTLSATFAAAQWETSDLTAGQNGTTNIILGSTSVTQSVDTMTITALNSVACPPDDDSYLRRFDLTADGIMTAFTVNSVDIGVESSTGANLTANIYSIPKAAPFMFANLTLLGSSGALPVPDGMLTFFNLPVNGTLTDPTADDLVVEIFAPDFAGGFSFFIGSNANGETAPSYLASAGCGAAEPTTTATIGFPNMHIVMVVNGDVAPSDADLSLSKTGDEMGGNVIYTLTVTNNGPADATNVVVTDNLPAELTYVSDDCGGMDVPPFTWNVGNLANGASAVCNVTTAVAPGASGTVVNDASVTSDQNDPNPGDENATASVTLGTVLDIPTLGQTGLLLLLLALAGLGVMKLRR